MQSMPRPDWLPEPVAFTVFGKDVYWYGILIAIGVLIGVLMAMRRAKKMGYNPDHIVDFCLLAIPMAIIGARLFYVLTYKDANGVNPYFQDPLSMLYIWQGGLAIFGGVIGGLLAAWIFYRWRKIPFWDLADIAAPSLILGQAIGRWGNFFNQEAFGYVVVNPDWQLFPVSVWIDNLARCTDPLCKCAEYGIHWHMATFFYESMWNFLVFIILLLLLKSKKRRSGDIFISYIVLYSLGRAVVEGFRTDSLMVGGLRISQLVSILLIVAGIVLLILRHRTRKGTVEAEGVLAEPAPAEVEKAPEETADKEEAEPKEE
jgi:phosphatidylglycerol:prolipoprotein diacylglycerol transferase